MIVMLRRQAVAVYGDGQQIRTAVCKDHCSAIRRVLEAGRVGEVYNVGGCNEKPNIEIVHTVCALLDELRPRMRQVLPRTNRACRRPPRP